MTFNFKSLAIAAASSCLIASGAFADTDSPSVEDRMDKPIEAGALSYGEKATTGYRDNATTPATREFRLHLPPKNTERFASDRRSAGSENPVGPESNVGYDFNMDAPRIDDGDGVADAIHNMESENDSFGVDG